MNIGDLVFIKDERDKNKVRDRYIIVAVDEGQASLQKLTDKFMSRKYIVPLTRLYPTFTPPCRFSPRNSEEEDSDEDYESSDIPSHIRQDSIVDVDSDDEVEQSHPDQPSPPVAVCLQRVCRETAWIRDGEYDMSSDDH